VNTTSGQAFRNKIERVLGPVWATRLRRIVRGREVPRWGNLRRLKPFSNNFGWERGTPVDRYYVDRFFERHRALITGDVLEIDRNIYTRRFGHDLRTVHSFDIEPKPDTTFACDLAHSESVLESEAYDCVLLPCTLSFFRELDLCLRNALRVVRPGGVILASASGIIRVEDSDDLWRFTPFGWREVLQRIWPGCELVVESEGNCLAVAAFNLGLASEELKPEELNYGDELFPVAINIFCRKPKR
jgi:SAM-dependent methyltransferase